MPLWHKSLFPEKVFSKDTSKPRNVMKKVPLYELKTYVREKKTVYECFLSSIIVTAKKWKQPKCPSTDKWIVCPHNRILFGHKK